MALSKLTLAPARTLMRQAARGMARKPIVGGNWKCNPATASSLDELVSNFDGCAQYLDKCDVYVCPSNLHVALVKDSFKPGIKVAPQNCNFTGCGAYTGEMSVDQIKDMGMSTVLIGHSERRGEFGLPTPKESNQLMATKLQYILDQGLSCVFCIGEPLPIREKGVDAVLAECANQLEDVRSRRPAVRRRLHAIDATRVHLTRSWVVYFFILRPFGPRRATAMLPRRNGWRTLLRSKRG